MGYAMSDKYRGGSFRSLKIRADERDERRLTAKDSRLNLVQTARVLKERVRYSFN